MAGAGRGNNEVERLASRMEAYEAAASIAKTGTGSRREGEGFERLVAEFWTALRDRITSKSASIERVGGGRGRVWSKLAVRDRALYLPDRTHVGARTAAPSSPQSTWLEVVFPVSELVAAFPTTAEAISRYSPSTGRFSGPRYPEMYSGLTTKFDDTIVLEEAGVLREKLLLEYKTAKSSKGIQIDGNAHERLSFQVMQYLEVATRYTRCSLVVITNGAYVRYRNKYHVNFHVQADRLSNFSWFAMDHACTQPEYLALADSLSQWLFAGRPRK
jgi:hypothetical protein